MRPAVRQRPRGAARFSTPSPGSYQIERAALPEAERLLTSAWPVLRARFGNHSYFGDQCLEHLSRLYEIRGNSKIAHEYRSLLHSARAAD
jgi:hypothetical protein